MDRIGVIGMSWRGGSEALEAFTLPPEARAKALGELAAATGVHELLYLATCNRVEVAFVGDGETPISEYRPRIFEVLAKRVPRPGEAERAFKAWAGDGAAEHLFLVAAGLDSARVGETEIAHQLRQALTLAREEGLAGPRLNLVVEEALKIAARVHTQTQVGGGRLSLAELALDHLRLSLSQGPGAVALIGVGPMCARAGRALIKEGVDLWVVNRTFSHAQALADELGAQALSLEAFKAAPPPLRAILTATAAPGHIISPQELASIADAAPAPLVIVDMAIPSDIPKDAALSLGCQYIDMAAITRRAEANRGERLKEAADARLLVDEGLLALRRDLSDRMVAPLIKALRRRGAAHGNAALAKLLRKELSHLPEADQAALHRYTKRLINGLIHIPTVGLRALAKDAGPEAVEAFLKGIDPLMAEGVLLEFESALGSTVAPDGAPRKPPTTS